MRFGAFRALAVSVGKRAGAPLTESVELARRAESAGFGIVSVGEGGVESFSMLGALALATTNVELLSNVATWTRTPVTAALAATTVGDLSGGRFRLGLGPMPRDWSEQWHDVSYERPVERMRDYVAAIRGALGARGGEPASHEGPYYRFSGYRPPMALPWDGAVPIYLAATRPKMSELAGEVADGVVFNALHSVSWLRDALWPRVDRGLERGGRTRAALDVGLLCTCAIAGSEEEARDLARPTIGFYFHTPYLADVLRHHGFDEELERGSAASARGDREGMVAAVSDRMVEAMTLAGTPEQVREKIRRYEGLVDWIQLTNTLGQTPEAARRQTERILDTFAA